MLSTISSMQEKISKVVLVSKYWDSPGWGIMAEPPAKYPYRSIQEQKDHPILRGVSKVHVQAVVTTQRHSQTGYSDHGTASDVDGTRWQRRSEKPPMASEWTREYTAKNGKKGRVFTSLYGASQDLLNPGYRRLILNGIYWSVGLEDKIKADARSTLWALTIQANFR